MTGSDDATSELMRVHYMQYLSKAGPEFHIQERCFVLLCLNQVKFLQHSKRLYM